MTKVAFSQSVTHFILFVLFFCSRARAAAADILSHSTICPPPPYTDWNKSSMTAETKTILERI